jgi:acetyltransferase
MNIPQHSPLTGDPAQSVLSRPQPLDAFFKPRSVAVIGATETPHSVGRTILQPLRRHHLSC